MGLLISLFCAGCAREHDVTKALGATRKDVMRVAHTYEEGEFVTDERYGGPAILEMGAAYFQEWRCGIEGYGVQYQGFNTAQIEKTFQSALPEDLTQILEGEWEGAFENREGNLVVPGARYFPPGLDISFVVAAVDHISDICKARADEATVELRQIQAFYAQYSGPVTLRVLDEALEHKASAVRKGAIIDLCMNDIPGIDQVAILVGKLNGPAEQVRETAAQYLAGMRDARALPAFRRAAKDQNARVRLWAALALAGDDSGEALGILQGLAADDPCRNVRAAAQYSLQRWQQHRM